MDQGEAAWLNRSGGPRSLARAKEQGISLGRRRLEDSDAAKVTAIKTALAAKRGVRRIARDLETGVGTALRMVAKKMVRCRTHFPMVPVTTRPHVLLPWVIVGAVVMFALFGR